MKKEEKRPIACRTQEDLVVIADEMVRRLDLDWIYEQGVAFVLVVGAPDGPDTGVGTVTQRNNLPTDQDVASLLRDCAEMLEEEEGANGD